MKKIMISFLFIVSFIFVACDVGLGSTIYLLGPVVNITGPQPDRSSMQTDPQVNALFALTGTVESRSKIARVAVTVDYWNGSNIVRMGREWQWKNAWQIRESDDSSWRQYTSAVYGSENNSDKPVAPPSWTVSGETVYFTLPILMSRMESGEYFITISAWDSAGNHDSNSSKMLKVRFSNIAPKFVVTSPKLQVGGGGSLVQPRPPVYSSFIFDPYGRPELTFNNIDKFTNDFENFTWEIEPSELAPLEGAGLTLMITNEHDLDDPSNTNRIIYYEWTYLGSDMPQKGAHDGITVHDDGSIFEKIVLNANAASLPNNQITPLQMISVLYDTVGNREYKSNGWFFYLPDSDKPYPEINFASVVKPGAPPPAEKRVLRGVNDANNMAFDDDGVKRVIYTVYKLKDNTNEVETQFPQVIPDIYSGKSVYWTFVARPDYGVGRFRIDVQVTDINDREGDIYSAYFYIDSNSTPTWREWNFDVGETLWGDTHGNFNISGIAQIECSDNCDGDNHSVKVNNVYVVWMNPANRTAQNLTRYEQPNDPNWNIQGDHFTDNFGNKVWKVPQGNIEFVSGTKGNKNQNHQEDWRFRLDLNWFSNEINIGVNAGQVLFSNQTFKVKIISDGASGAGSLASVKSVNVLGDIEEPVLTIDTIHFAEYDANNTLIDQRNIDLNSTVIFPQIRKNTKLKISGTWSDDSVGAWKDVEYQKLIKNLSVRWEGETKRKDFQITAFSRTSTSGGAWETDELVFNDQNTDPLVTITAALIDVNNGPGKKDRELIIETDYPTLTRISSTVFDGRYGDYKQTYHNVPDSRYIDIFLDFNKPINIFHAGSPPLTSANTPYLNLNNGGKAFYREGSGSNRIMFRYFIDNKYTSLSNAYSSPSTSVNRLNVTEIVPGGYPFTQWQSVAGDDEVKIPDNYETDNISLAWQKNIIIDKQHPVITNMSTTTSNDKPHGAGSQIRVNVKFSEEIRVIGALADNLYLNLGITGAKAVFDSAGTDNINFIYTVKAGDNGAVAVTSLTGNNYITDIAGNTVQQNASSSTNAAAAITISPANPLNKPLAVDTAAPAAPVISGDVQGKNGKTIYNDTYFIISGLDADVQTVEYCLQYDPSKSNEWITYTGVIDRTNGQTAQIPIKINGVYTIAARVYDNATTPNVSSVSAAVSNVTVNKGALLERITSSNSDGVYGSGNTIQIVAEFRIPLTLAAGAPSLTLNTTGGGANTVVYSSGTGTNKWTFNYTITEGTTTNNAVLNVTGFNLNDTGITINDQHSTKVNLNTLINLPAANNLGNLKNIQILAGKPGVDAIPAGLINTNAEGNIVFTGNELQMTFNRDIYRGTTANKLIVRQIANDFRIPAVLSSDRFNEIFSGRNDIFTDHSNILTGAVWTSGTAAARAELWSKLGDYLYEQGSNGASRASNTETARLVPDKTIKRVLKFNIDPAASDNTVITFSGGSTTMADIKALFRAAEALSFGVNDPDVVITNINGNPRRLDIRFSQRGGLPVRGARYQLIFPNGFVKDILGKLNSGSASDAVNDTNLSTGAITGNTGARVLNYTGITETPVIRVDKGNDEIDFNVTGDNRQAKQKLLTQIRIDCRTPDSDIVFYTRQTTDNVGTLITRNGTASSNYSRGSIYLLPNLGNLATSGSGDTGSRASYENTRLRPQSGVNGLGNNSPVTGNDWRSAGLNYNTDISAVSWTHRTEPLPYEIGENNYITGGMEINIRAYAVCNGNTDSTNAYEAAYRSVLVFSNQNIHGNAGIFDFTNTNTDNPVVGGNARTRVWVRGGDSTDGDPTIPDFPISRDPQLWKKAKLLTPVNTGALTANSVFNNSNIITSAVGNGQYLWFWVTWRINVTAFIDLFTADLPTTAELSAYNIQGPRTNIRQFFQGYIFAKEHYAVHPGRTTILETRRDNDIYRYHWDGERGNMQLTSPVAARTPPLDP